MTDATPTEKLPHELLPCPFCGSDARMMFPKRDQVICEGCGAMSDNFTGMGNYVPEDRHRVAAQRWNRRQPPAARSAAAPDEGRDAARYRWLRENLRSVSSFLYADELDAAIDAAMSQHREPEGDES